MSLLAAAVVAAPGTAAAARTETVAPIKFGYLPKQIQKEARRARADLGGPKVAMRAYMSPNHSAADKRLDPGGDLIIKSSAPIWIVTYKGKLKDEGESGTFAYETWSIRTGRALGRGFFPKGVPRGF